MTTVAISRRTDALIPRLFLHFLDIYHYRIARYVFKYPRQAIFAEMRLAFRLSFLLAHESFVSASAYFENDLTRKIIREHREICEAGFIFLTSGEPTLSDHFEKKQRMQYDHNSPQELVDAYRSLPSIPVLYRAGDIKTAVRITDLWNQLLETGNLHIYLDPGQIIPFPKRFEEIWAKVPKVLEKRAFVAPHVQAAFGELGTLPPSELQLLKVLDPGYTISHAEPLQCGLVDQLLYLQPPWHIAATQPGFSFKAVRDALTCIDLLTLIDRCSVDVLHRFRLSPTWATIGSSLLLGETIDISETVVDARRFLLAAKTPSRRRSDTSDLTIGIVTALPEEWLAVTKCLSATACDDIDNDPNRYAIAHIAKNDGSPKKLGVIVTFLPRVGTNSAATVTTNLLRSFPGVSDLIFCGIACGCPFPSDPQKHVRLGDIVVSDLRGLIQLDHQAVKATSTENRSNMPIPSRSLLNCVRLLQADEMEEERSWELILDNLISINSNFRRPSARTDILTGIDGRRLMHPKDRKRMAGQPQIFQGAIGSWNTLLRNRKVRDRLAKRYNLRAIEMEGAGTAEAVWHFGKNYLVVRGICDYGDPIKNDLWHNYAAGVAAAYTKALLVKMATGGKSNA